MSKCKGKSLLIEAKAGGVKKMGQVVEWVSWALELWQDLSD
jgi:hypothetical protein